MIRSCWKTTACAAVCLVSASSVLAQPRSPAATPRPGRTATAPYVKVELIAAPAADRDGRRWLGVRFDLEDKWHLYWRNPGDSGGPPEATWTLPDGVRAGGFEWPLPERIESAGLVNYGYYGTLVLPVPLSRAAGGAATGTVSVSLRWMVCRDMCVPGKATLELDLASVHSGQPGVSGWTAAIDQARNRTPRPAPPAWKARASSSRENFDVTITTGQRETDAYFFPIDAGQVNDSAPQVVVPLPDGVRVTLKKSEFLRGEPAALNGVVSLPGGRSFVVTAPVAR